MWLTNIHKISKVIEVCKEVSIDIAVGPRHYYWGTLEIVIKDPDGTVLVFIAPYDEMEAELVGADENFAVKQ